MKKKDMQQLKEQSVEALVKLVGETQAKINNLKAEMYAGREKNVKAAWEERRKLAITKTLITEKQIKEK